MPIFSGEKFSIENIKGSQIREAEFIAALSRDLEKFIFFSKIKNKISDLNEVCLL